MFFPHECEWTKRGFITAIICNITVRNDFSVAQCLRAQLLVGSAALVLRSVLVSLQWIQFEHAASFRFGGFG